MRGKERAQRRAVLIAASTHWLPGPLGSLKFRHAEPNDLFRRSPCDHRDIFILMIPSKFDPRWVPLVKGETNYRFSSAAASMLFFCLRAKLKADNSGAAVQQAVEEAHVFFTKYERTLQPDIRAIFN